MEKKKLKSFITNNGVKMLNAAGLSVASAAVGMISPLDEINLAIGGAAVSLALSYGINNEEKALGAGVASGAGIALHNGSIIEGFAAGLVFGCVAAGACAIEETYKKRKAKKLAIKENLTNQDEKTNTL